VSPTFLVDQPILILIGLLAGFFIPKNWEKSLFFSRAFWVGSFIALGFMGLSYYGYLKAPDWMFGYLFPASQIPTWAILFIYISFYLLYVLGFLLQPQLRKIHFYCAVSAPALALATEGILLALQWRAYQTIASFEDFHQGRGIHLSESEVGKEGTFPMIAIVLAGIFLFIWAKRQKTT